MKLKQLLTAALLLCSAGAWAQTDVTSDYITNAGFDESSDFQTDNVATGGSNQRKAVTGWTNSGGDTYTTGAAIGFGTSGQINGTNLPSTNSDGNATGGALCLNAAWQSQVWYAQEVTLPAGNYTMTFKVNNVGKNGGFEKDPPMFLFTTTDGSSFSGNVHSYPVDTWTTQTIAFALASETTGTIKIGYKATNTGSGNTPKLIVDYVKAMYNSNYTATLQSAIDRATILNARASDDDLAAAITTAQGVLDAADNSIAYQATINSAVTTLRTAINTAAAKVVLLEGENITFMFENADFESGMPVTVGITTYDYDAATNGTHYSRMQVVEGWTIAENGNAKSAGIYEFGQNPFLGSTGTQYQAPASGSATGEEKALGIVAVWSSSAQYKQDCTLPAGSYIIEVPVYNTAGTTAFSKNLIGFVENGGTEHLATAKTYATGSWITEKIIFELENETAGYLSLGYTAANAGSGSMPHLFIDNVKVTYTSPIAAAYQRYQDALQAAQDAIDDSDYDNVTGNERTALQSAIDATPAQTKEAYNDAADALDAAREAFTGAKANYDAFVAAKATVVPDLAYAATAKKTALTDAIAATASTSAEAATNAAAIITALRAYYESHALAEVVSEAVNYNSAVADANADTNSGWTNGVGTNQGQGYTDSEGNVASKYLDGGWAASAACNVDMTRSVEIPAGRYLLTVKARGAQDLTVYTLSIAGETINLPHANGGSNGVFGNGWEDASIEFESDGTALTLEVIAQSTANQQWFSMNDFRLVQLEANNDVYAGATEYAALNAAIEAAEAKTLGFDNGEYAPYNNVEALTALAAAKAIDQTAEQTNLKTDVEALTTALGNWIANAAEVNAIYDGDFALQAEHTTPPTTLAGWTAVEGLRQLIKNTETDPGLTYASANAAIFTWGGTTITYGEQNGYSLPLDANVYKLTFKVAGWRDGDLPSWMSAALYKNGSEVQTVSKTPTVVGRINDAEGNPFISLTYYLTVPEAGNYVLKLYTNKHTTWSDFNLVKAVAENITISEDADFIPTEAFANITLSRTLNEGSWNSFVVPFDIPTEIVKDTFGEDVEVAEFSDEGESEDAVTVNFTKMATPEITANTPVLLKPSSVEGGNIYFNAFMIEEGTVAVGGSYFDFVGTYAASTTIAEGDYFIRNNMLYKSAGSTNIKGTRAYLKAKSAGVKAVLFIDGVATCIEAINNGQLTMDNATIYNLAGQRVNKAQKGIFIVNGKKVLVK